MTNLAAIILAAKANLEVREVETYKPGPLELLVKNEIITFNPLEAKIARLALLPIEYPFILGMSFGGTVEEVGAEVTGFQVGDKVAVHKDRHAVGSQYGAYQKYVVAETSGVSKVPEGTNVTIPASLMGNISSVVGLFTGSFGLDKPGLDSSASTKSKKILIYGGTSSFGSMSVQYVARAGYTVITTTSPKHEDLVSSLGAENIIDHTLDHDALLKALVAWGPYDLVVDTISLPSTIAFNSEVVAAQGGGKVVALLPAFEPETLPQGVTRDFLPWADCLAEEKNAGLEKWAYTEYLPQSIASGRLIPLPTQKVDGGLKKVNDALDMLVKGVSGVKLVLDPWE